MQKTIGPRLFESISNLQSYAEIDYDIETLWHRAVRSANRLGSFLNLELATTS